MTGLDKGVPTPENTYRVAQPQGNQDACQLKEKPYVGRIQENQYQNETQFVVFKKERSQVSHIPTTSQAANECLFSTIMTIIHYPVHYSSSNSPTILLSQEELKGIK